MAVRVWLVALLALVLATAAFPAEQPSELLVELSLPKTSFEVGERIGYEIKITNTSGMDIPVVTGGTPGAGHTLVVYDSSGNKAPFTQMPSSVFHSSSSSSDIRPGAAVTLEGAMNRWAVLSSPGEYTASAETYPPCRSAVRAKGTSAPVTFTVVPWTDNGRRCRYDAALKAIADAKSQWERQRAVDDLGYTLDPMAIPELVKLARTPDVAYPALSALYTFGDRARDAVIEDLSKNGTMPYQTSDMMRAFHIPADEMIQMAERWFAVGDTEQKAKAVMTLSAVGTSSLSEQTRAQIKSLLHSPEPQLRSAALSVAYNPAFNIGYEEVRELAEQYPSKSVRRAAASALLTYRSRTEETVGVLSALLNAADKDMAGEYAFYLRASRAPSARAALEAGAKSSNADVKAACEKQLKEWEPAN